MRQGIDALVGSPVPAGFREGQRQSAISLDARVNLAWGLGLTYSGTLYPGATWTLRDPNGNPVLAPPNNTTITTEANAPKGKLSLLGQQNFGISFAPACNCWRLDIIGRLPPPFGQFVQQPPAGSGPFVPSTFNWRFPDLIFLLTIQNFGTFGAS